MVPRASVQWAGRLASSSTKRGYSAARSPRIWHQQMRRGYASQASGHGTKKASGDLPWAITSAAVSIPAGVYLLQSGPETGHGHGHEGEEHDGEHNEDPEEGDSEGEVIAAVPDLRKTDSEGEEGEGAEQGGGTEGAEEGKEESEDKSDDQSSSSDSEGEDQKETPDTSDDEQPENVAHKTDSGANVEGVQFKGATSGGSREGEQGDTRLHIPDAKGGNKKRISSDYGNRQGVAQDDDSKAGTTTDKPAASKTPGDRTTTSGKQEGLSNTDTKHSTNIESDPDKSKKGEGTPETAKSKGTVDPQRPQAENRPGPEESNSTTR